METALQQAIDKIRVKMFDDRASMSAYTICIEILQSLIPAEKEQINSAYYDGWYDKEKQIDQDYTIQFNDDYYTQTYQSK